MRFLALALAIAGLTAVCANIVSVDVGSDSFKIALVKPGLPFHIVSNPQSKRKVRRDGARDRRRMPSCPATTIPP